jgi:hypothetical protein
VADILSQVITQIKTEKANLAETVTAGINVNSFDDYQRLVGRYEGLDMVLRVIEEILTGDEES